MPNPADYCEGNELPLNYSPYDPFDPPTDIIWMLDDQPVHTGMTYQPTQSGSYWPVLIDHNGCKFYEMVTKPRHYTIRKPPHVSIVGTTSMCAGESTVLTGIITDNTVQHRWTGPFFTNRLQHLGNGGCQSKPPSERAGYRNLYLYVRGSFSK